MNISVKSQILSKQFISKLSFNQTYSILAAIVDSADTVAFFHLQTSRQILHQIFQGTSKPSGKKSSIAWSNDGKYLALGSNNLELWAFDGKKMSPIKVYGQDFVDVKLMAWSPDSTSIAYGGLSKKNTIKIKNIQNSLNQELNIPLIACSISYDPFGKYLLILLRNNILYVYDSNKLTKVRQVSLCPSAKPHENINTVKDIRGLAWSPDFNHLICPSLDDSKIALALDLHRSNNFKVRQAFLGHVSPIICAKFNPNLYQFQGQVTSIVALGDSHGAISIWRVGTKMYSSPLLLLNSSSQYHEVAEDMDWDDSGTILLANVMKRYVNLVSFDKQKFGRQLSSIEKARTIQQSYGVKSAAEMNRSIEIFSLTSLQSDQLKHKNITQQISGQLLKSNIKDIEIKKKQNQIISEQGPNFHPFNQKVEYVKVNEQVTTTSKNNKKRIQPAMLIRKDQVDNPQTTQSLPQQHFATSLNLFSTIGSYQPLKLKPIQYQPRITRLSSNLFLQIKKIQGYSLAQLYDPKQTEKNVRNQRVFTGTINWLKIINKKIYVHNQGNLYIFDEQLKLLELPYTIGQIHRITINQEADVYYLSTKGSIRGFNHKHKTCYTPMPVALQDLLQNVVQLQKSESNGQTQQKQDINAQIVQDFRVQRNHNLYVVLPRSKIRYFYCRQTRCWISLQLNSSLLRSGHSLRISQEEQKVAASFLNSLTARSTPQNNSLGHLSVQQYETNMIYYKLHSPNPQLYRQNLFGMIRQLKSRNQTTKLRSCILTYFIDTNSQVYERDQRLRDKVRQLGGNVIQQFALFGQL